MNAEPLLPEPYYTGGCVTLYHGDSRAILPLLSRGTIITDPPFNIGYHYDKHIDRLPEKEYFDLLKQTITPPCVVIHYPAEMFAVSNLLGLYPERVVAWVYPSNTARQHRSVAWFGCSPDFTKDGQDYRNPTDKRVAKLIAAGRRARLYDWWEVNQVKNVGADKTCHPCQMPLEVMLRVLRITQPALVIDPFAGSGTTLLAAKQLGIQAIGIELSEQYCELIANRLR